MNKIFTQVLATLTTLIYVIPAFACFAPPAELTRHHAELVADSKTIVLARVTGGSKGADFGWFGTRQLAQFEVVEILRGDVDDSFSLENGLLGSDEERAHDPGDFRGHRDSMFWDKHITRQWNMPDCTMQPMFFEGQTYLIFVDRPHWRAYEEIRNEDDLWLDAVRRLIYEPSLTSGVTMNLKEWLSLSRSVFIGEIEACDGPVLSVTETLHGVSEQTWRYSEDDMYFPNSRCSIGSEYLVVTYASEPSALPYYSSSMFPIQDGQIDFGDALEDTEIDVEAEPIQQIDDLTLLFMSDEPR